MCLTKSTSCIPDFQYTAVTIVNNLYEGGVVCSPASKQGYAMHMYAASSSMTDCSFCNADGDFLIVPQLGLLETVLLVTLCLLRRVLLQTIVQMIVSLSLHS